MSDVTIIGAGVAGLCAAHELVRRGLRPRILDRNGPPGPHACSWWAGGMLAPWCEGVTAEPVVTRLGAEAAAAWARVTPVTRNGTLVVALDRDRAELARFARRATGHQSCDTRDVEPDLPRRQGLIFPDEAHLDPRRALADLQAALAAEGITIEQAEATPEDLSGTVVDARGLSAAQPGLRGVRGEMVVLHAPDIRLSRPVRLLHPRYPIYLVPREGGLFMLGATQLESASRAPVSARSVLELLSAAYALDPRFAEASVVELGADLRPAFADNVPRITVRGRVLHLNGLFRHGYLMAPVLARQAADYLLTGTRGELLHED
ncbi:FAD-dependent oxidoreductase [Paracoccus beibuensis]|uniref:FAD-dependent oxidoreductase n=1 Tax=Paracoccus beibuensis TaxID=547602 RepID=UPI00223F2E36|nr:FAD-dependent oxidoreductase [Paracoccus beibuensis]